MPGAVGRRRGGGRAQGAARGVGLARPSAALPCLLWGCGQALGVRWDFTVEAFESGVNVCAQAAEQAYKSRNIQSR